MPSITVLHLAQALERFARKKRKNGVYLHIAEESSEIAIWKDGVFALTEAIPLGGTHFTKVFENVLGMRKNTAQEFQERYFAGKLSEELRSQIKTLLAPPLNDFAALVKERLFQLNMSLPENIWIFGKGCKVREIFEMFEDDRVEKDLPFSQKPQPAFLLPKDIWNLERFPKNADPSYTGLFLLGYAEHAREEKGY